MVSTTDSDRSDVEMLHRDLGSNGQTRVTRRWLVHAWKMPLPLRKDHVASDLFKVTACFVTVVCIFEFVWIMRLQAGLVRVQNDPYDIRFGGNMSRNNPLIWDNVRQSFIHNSFPVPVHSHNDYWRQIPLFEALGSGCTSVEADVHLQDSDLYVGHTSASTNSDDTLRTMYLEPLQRMIESQNTDTTQETRRGIFNQDPHQTVVLLIDHKTAGAETFAELDKQLQPLRNLDFLTYWNGTARVMRPLTIVASGNAPFASVMALNDTHRDIFWDAPLDRLMSASDNFNTKPPIYGYNGSNSFYASTRWKQARLWPHWHNESMPMPNDPAVIDALSSQIDQAKARGLISRYWDTPSGPPNLLEIIWRVLVERQVGIINMDDLGAVRARAKGWGNIGASNKYDL